jgi:hypothetical protein
MILAEMCTSFTSCIVGVKIICTWFVLSSHRAFIYLHLVCAQQPSCFHLFALGLCSAAIVLSFICT